MLPVDQAALGQSGQKPGINLGMVFAQWGLGHMVVGAGERQGALHAAVVALVDHHLTPLALQQQARKRKHHVLARLAWLYGT